MSMYRYVRTDMYDVIECAEGAPGCLGTSCKACRGTKQKTAKDGLPDAREREAGKLCPSVEMPHLSQNRA
jgi:hypothetical protein